MRLPDVCREIAVTTPSPLEEAVGSTHGLVLGDEHEKGCE